MVKEWLKLVRIGNVLFIGGIPILLHYGFVQPMMEDTGLSTIELGLLFLSLVCIGAAGNIINDVFDQETDQINKPEKRSVGKTISEKSAFWLFGLLSFTGFLLFCSVAFLNDQMEYVIIYPFNLVLLWLYAMELKGRIIVGNIIIAFLAGTNVFIVALFDLLPIEVGRTLMFDTTWNTLLAMSAFAFLTTLIREIVKDLEDIKGDLVSGYKTLANSLASRTVKGIILLLILLEVFALLRISSLFYPNHFGIIIWTIAILILPILLISLALIKASTPKQYHRISSWLKLYMLIGLFSPLVLTLSFFL